MKAFRVLVLRLNHLGRMIVTFLFRAAKKVLLWIRKHPKTSGGIGVILVLVFLGATWLFKPPAPEYILAVAERSDLQQTVEAVGTIISEKDLTLKFPVTGVVAEVFVTEGDVISVGQELARLRNDALAADVQAAAAALASKNASLRELREGTSPEDLAIAEAEVENKRAALASAKTTLAGAEEKLRTAQQKIENLRAEVDIALSGYTATSQSSASQQATAANAALQKIEDVFSTNTIRSVIMQEQSSAFTILENEIARAQNALIAVRPLITSGFGDYQTAIVSLQTTRAAIFGASRAVDSSYTFVSNLPPAGGFTTSEKETHKATLATQSSNAQAALAAIDTASKNLQDAAANYSTAISAEENTLATAQSTKENALSDILTYETALRTQEAQLEKKRSGARQTEIDSAAAGVNQAAAELNRARAKLEDTVLRAPFAGTITKVAMKAGEFTGDFDNFNYAISMLGASPYRVEMYASEIDIPKVQLGQTGAIILDAFPNEDVLLRVSEIDPIATIKDGVAKYLITLDFIEPRNDLRIGMSGDAEIYTAKQSDVITIPGRAVMATDGTETVRILKDNGDIEERTVVTGLSGADGNVEVISGIEVGEQIVVLIKE